MAVGDRVDQFRILVRQSLHDLFDQRHPFGRLALVQVFMLAGDTLVAISLAGTLFFSISPGEAKSKVLLYLLLTLAPFAVVSPLLGPAIDKSRRARRAMVVLSGFGRAGLCLLMATHIHSLLLFPLAFFILVLSKLYLVTRGALVPEMVALTAANQAVPQGDGLSVQASSIASPSRRSSHEQTGAPGVSGLAGGAGATPVAGVAPVTPASAATPAPAPAPPTPATSPTAPQRYATLNARLTLLGTLAGFVVSIPGVGLLKLTGSPGVLIFASTVFVVGAVAGLRLPLIRHRWLVAVSTQEAKGDAPAAAMLDEPDLARLQPLAHPEVFLALTTMSVLRGVAGFLVFFLAFGLRRLHAALWWYGFALALTGIGSLFGLFLVPRLRQLMSEQQILLCAICLVGAAATGAALVGTLAAQVVLAFFIGVAGAIGQPSFDAMTQHYVPLHAQGRAFAKFATRQQLVWVVGALVPVVVALSLVDGDVVLAVIAAATAICYLMGRRAIRHWAIPGEKGSHHHNG